MLTVSTRSPIVPHATPRASEGVAAFAPHVGLAMLAAGLGYLIGSIIDVGVLWGLQRQAVPQWEFVAIGNTLEAFPRFTMALAFLYGALYFRRSERVAAYRVLAVGLLLGGIAAAALGALLLTDYLALARVAAGQAGALDLLRTTTFKGLALSGLFTVTLVPIGLLGLRRPGGRRVSGGARD
ncbi:MAG TPA: hypothetical protein VF188_10610 [Longimicrobiales bacterium]